MNEKFNKDEVWGHLGKSSRAQEDADDLQNEDSVESSEVEVKPVYVKDDFFDSLSCDSLGGGSRNGRTRFSEQMRRDTEVLFYCIIHIVGVKVMRKKKNLNGNKQ
ncbi:hypothetical protein HRI_003371700 [Hibiscus trionum]|uniref:FFD box profile domain-containing protein n=1 Tax=Hibiscus trionum TaxID=183268 RepID=A0A9W7MEA2_HIBTR|nr:hypothetical protein HRI_003371700 [Hibiscus trionum]